VGCELLNVTLLGNLDLVSLERLFFAECIMTTLHSVNLLGLGPYINMFLVVAGQVGDQGIEVQEVAFQCSHSEIIHVYLQLWADLNFLPQEIRDLLLLMHELAVLLIQVIDDPD